MNWPASDVRAAAPLWTDRLVVIFEGVGDGLSAATPDEDDGVTSVRTVNRRFGGSRCWLVVTVTAWSSG